MKILENIQRFTEVGKATKVSVPASFSIILDNKTDTTVLFFESQFAKVPFPLSSGSVMELENIPESAETWIFIEEQENLEIGKNQGLYVVCRPLLNTEEKAEENNTVIINK